MRTFMLDPNGNGGAPLSDQGSQDFAANIGAPATSNRQPGTSEAPQEPAAGTPPAEGAPAKFRTGHNQRDPNAGATPETPVTPQAEVPGGTTPPAAQSQADIIRATVEATANAIRAQNNPAAAATVPSQQDRELSPQEFNAKYKVVQVTENDVAAILDQDPKKAAASLNRLLQGAAQQAVLMALDLSKAEVARIQDEYNPHITEWKSYNAERQAKASEDRFFKAYPILAEERATVMEMKDAILARVQSGQIKFASEQEAFKAVADATTALLTRFGKTPGAGGGGATNGQGAAQPPSRQMAVASSTGRTGSAGATAKSDVDKLMEHWSANP